MKYLFYLQTLFIILFCSCTVSNQVKVPELDNIPNKELKEIILHANYYLKPKQNRSDSTSSVQYSDHIYCYKKKEKKEPVYNKDFKFRLYDAKGEMLFEDFLRLKNNDHQDIHSVVSYLPYVKLNNHRL